MNCYGKRCKCDVQCLSSWPSFVVWTLVIMCLRTGSDSWRDVKRINNYAHISPVISRDKTVIYFNMCICFWWPLNLNTQIFRESSVLNCSSGFKGGNQIDKPLGLSQMNFEKKKKTADVPTNVIIFFFNFLSECI